MIDEDERQHHSARHYLGGVGPETTLQNAVHLTARHFDFPFVQLNVLDRSHQHTVVAHGSEPSTIPRSDGLCDRVIRSGLPWVAHDLNHPWGPIVVRTYVGVPLTGREGLPIAVLCLIDSRPRRFTPDDVDELLTAATVIQDHLELRRRQSSERPATPARSAAISRAIESGQIVPWFQPIIELATGKVRAVEALARWHRPDGVVELPAGFLATAENSDVIIDLDLAILGAAARAMPVAGTGGELMLNVNLSARHFANPDCVERLTDHVVEAGLEPRRVNFEITETTALEATPRDIAFLEDLHGRGFRVLLDDFGTGFSSIGHLLSLPIDGIKIDRSVTRTLNTRTGDAVVRALTQLTDDLDLDLCIEGVETPRQARQAEAMGCRHAQGYLWGTPAPAAQLDSILRQAAGRPDLERSGPGTAAAE